MTTPYFGNLGISKSAKPIYQQLQSFMTVPFRALRFAEVIPIDSVLACIMLLIKETCSVDS